MREVYSSAFLDLIAALPPGKEPRYPLDKKAGWVWTLRRGEMKLSLCLIS
jgi:hypothetical protein